STSARPRWRCCKATSSPRAPSPPQPRCCMCWSAVPPHDEPDPTPTPIAPQVVTLGADAVINTAVPDEALAQAYLDAKGDGYDVVLDYLWGRPTEILLRSLIPKSFAFRKPTRLIQIGESAGAGIVLAAE